MKSLLIKAVKFIGVSGIGWILDMATYTCLGFISDNLVINNVISSWVGVTFVFAVATRKVFDNAGAIPLWIKYAIYIAYQCVLIFLISKLIDWITNDFLRESSVRLISDFAAIIAKIMVTPITMVCNFFVMRWLTEKLNRDSQA